VEAVEAGSDRNVSAGRVIYLALPPSGITACTNPEAISGGQDEEDDESLRQRIMSTYNRLSNGANAAFYQQAAMAFDGVSAAAVLPRNRGAGTVDIVVTSHSGLPDLQLLEELQDYFTQVREIAVDVAVRPPEVINVNMNIGITPKPGYTFEQVAQTVSLADLDLVAVGLQVGLGLIHLHLEGLGDGDLGSRAHDLLVAHEGVGTPVHQLGPACIGIGGELHPGALPAVGVHQTQTFQGGQLQVGVIRQDAAEGGGNLIAGAGGGGVSHGTHAEAVQNNDYKSFHFSLPKESQTPQISGLPEETPSISTISLRVTNT
jgi:hypothetical protein